MSFGFSGMGSNFGSMGLRALGSVGHGAPSWVLSGALLDADYAGSRFWYNGNAYDEAGLNNALSASRGGVVSSGVTRIIGPCDAPDATELLTNTALADLTGWTSQLNGSSTAVASAGVVTLTSDGATGTGAGGAGITQAITTAVNKAYRFDYTIAGNTPAVREGSDTLGDATLRATSGRSPTAGSWTDTFNALYSSSYLYAYRAAAGTTQFSAPSAKECLPFPAFAQGAVTVRVSGTTPASASGTQGLWSAASGLFGNYEAQVYWSATGHLIALSKYGGTVSTIDLGVVDGNTSFIVTAGFANDLFWAQATVAGIKGSLLYTHSNNTGETFVPGYSRIFVGRLTASSTNWTGSSLRVTMWNSAAVGPYLDLIPSLRWTEGDSFMAGNAGVTEWQLLQTATGIIHYNTSQGGSSIDNILTRVTDPANASLLKRPFICDDGRINGVPPLSVAEYVGKQRAIATALGHSKFVFVMPIVTSLDDAEAKSNIDNIGTLMVTTFGADHVVDWRSTLTNVGGVVSSSMLQGDSTHLNATAANLKVPVVNSRIAALEAA